MIKLIRNEMLKIIKKPSTYILVIFIVLFVFGTNYLYRYKLDENGNYINSSINYSKELETQKLKLSQCDNCNIASIKSEIAINELYLLYGSSSWQAYIIENRDIKGLLNDMYESNDNSIKAKYELYINKFKEDDWKYFVEEEINYYEGNEDIIEILNYRLKENIKYGYDYINRAIEEYINNPNEVDKYIIYNKENIKKMNDTRGILSRFFNEYEILLIVSLIILGSSIISEEFNKNTIKQVLITPNSRISIYASKCIVLFILFVLLFILILVLELIFGGIFFGFESINVPVIIFKNSIEKFNVFSFIILNLIYKLPLFIIIIELLMLLGLISKNTVITSIFTLLFYFITFIILDSNILTNIPILKMMVNIHWDLTHYLFNETIYGLTLVKSLLIDILYIIILFVLPSKIFINMDIKNN